jgi:hypothetical protein
MKKPLVIGKAAKPWCFQNLDIRKLPVEWRSNKKAWMTSKIMEEWLTAFNSSILLLVADGHHDCMKCTRADVRLRTPDDEQKGCPKHVEL